jgi:hypothetical protein
LSNGSGKIALFFLTALGLVSACNSRSPVPTIASVTPLPATVIPASPPPTPPASLSEDLLAGSAAVLNQLQSYRYHIVFEVVGAAGLDQAVRIDLQGEHEAPDHERVRWVLPGGGQFLAVTRIGDQLWLQEGDAWNLLPPDQAKDITQGLFTPRQVWESFASDLPRTSKLVGEEGVNGILSLHYTSTSRAWSVLPLASGGQVTNASGDVWIAHDGHFPVRARFTATGTDRSGQPMTVTFRFEVLDVNEPLSIPPPVPKSEGRRQKAEGSPMILTAFCLLPSAL